MSKNEEKPLYSSHIFMFPFRFDWNENGFDNEFEFYDNVTFSNRLDFERLFGLLSKNGWEYKPFQIEVPNDIQQSRLNYNEFGYFYDYARDAIFNLKALEQEAISYYFQKKITNENAKYHIQIKGLDAYSLDLTEISLRVFNTGVAILSIDIDNHDYKSFKDILKINDYGRRVYPQFYGNQGVEDTKGAFLADYVRIDFEKEKRTEVFKETHQIKIGQHIMHTLGDEFSDDRHKKKQFYIQPILDDRMFVNTWSGHKLSESLRDSRYLTNNKWYQYVFVDGKEKTVFSPNMQKRLIQDATYDRWMNYKWGLALYGMSRYSFVALTNNSEFAKSKLRNDVQSLYFQMIILLLAIRTSILRFSDEIASLASHETLDTEKLSKLYHRYLTFYNRLYFKELTHQEQGIELYDMARKQMKIDEHMEKLDGKFTKLFEFAKMQSDDIASEKMDKLTVMGAIFLPPSLMVALFSMGIFEYEQEDVLNSGLMAILISGFLGYLGVNIFNFKNKLFEKLLPFIMALIFMLLVYFSLHTFVGEKQNKINDVNITNQVIKVEM